MADRPGSLARNRQQTAVPQEQFFDTHPEVSLDFDIVRQSARQKYTRPFLIIDTAIVREKLRRFRAAMPRVRPHYAVKANPDRLMIAGPLLGDDGVTVQGSLLVIEAADRAAAEAFAAGDPYAKAGLFESVTIKAFKKVLP